MVSVYRDTVLEFITENSSGKTVFNYDKANQHMQEPVQKVR